MQKPSTFAFAAGVLVAALAGCGGSSSTSTTSSASTSATAPPATTRSTAPSPAGARGALTLAADPGGQLRFTKSSLNAKPGKVTIRFSNSSPVAHNLTIAQGSGGPVIGATPTFQGGNRTLDVTLKPGTYTFFCSVPGHRAAGMHGTLVVK